CRVCNRCRRILARRANAGDCRIALRVDWAQDSSHLGPSSMRCSVTKATVGVAVAATAWLVSAAPPAAAQERSDLFGFAGTAWQVGGFAFVTPKFEGSKSYDVLGFPFIAPAGFGQGGSSIDIRGADDIRFPLIQNNCFEAGPLARSPAGRA